MAGGEGGAGKERLTSVVNLPTQPSIHSGFNQGTNTDGMPTPHKEKLAELKSYFLKKEKSTPLPQSASNLIEQGVPARDETVGHVKNKQERIKQINAGT